MPTEAEILAARRRKAEQLRRRGVSLFPARVPKPLDPIPEIVSRYEAMGGETLERERPTSRVAGRIVRIRSFGKAAFAVLQGDGVRLQTWCRQDRVGEDPYSEFKLYDVGDFIWAEGPLVRTKSDELTVEVDRFGLLAKAYRPLPEKWHGLVDVETRYRRRYLDLLVNPRARELAVIRSRTVTAIRAFLDARGFMEAETPILQPIYGGANARPFRTHHNAYDETLYLRISDELYLKRLLVGGFDRVYEIGRDFRNEGIDRRRNPEFSMLEVYEAYADYEGMMEIVESLVAGVAERVLGTTRVTWQEQEIDLAPPWSRRPMRDLIRDETGIDLERAGELDDLRREVRKLGLPDLDAERAPTWARLVDDLFSETVEPKLVSPTFVLDYPVELSPLAKRSPDRSHLVERFEAFVGGMEIANAFTELNDPDDQRVRFEEQARARTLGDDEAHPIDEDFLYALECGMPPTGGMGMGIGRLLMVLTGAPSLREVELFPHLRSRDD
jgi:lysyl-tRNA synthetase class 2